jgi:1-acyl-sn-glycerol-3-phosphate acyltransferase
VRLEESPLPEAPVVVVANHTSYVDVIVLAAALPFDCAMVAKRELFDRILLRPVLRRLGVVGVDRFHSRESAEDARRLQAIVDRGGSLVFFPEGTLARGAGVQAFHLGAFRVAAEAQVPVVPVSIRGARSMLRPEQWFVRRSALSVTVHAAIRPQGSGWEEALRLRDLARAAIIQGCGEPDLGQAADYAKPPRPPPDVAGHRAA